MGTVGLETAQLKRAETESRMKKLQWLDMPAFTGSINMQIDEDW